MLLALAAATALIVLPPGFGKGIRPRTRRPPPAGEIVVPSEALPGKAPAGIQGRSAR